jgi:hypothetical protein
VKVLDMSVTSIWDRFGSGAYRLDRTERIGTMRTLREQLQYRTRVGRVLW